MSADSPAGASAVTFTSVRRRARSIVLFHDVQPATIEMLPRFLKWVTEESLFRKARGEPPFKFIDYSFLLNPAHAAPPPSSIRSPSS